MTTMLFHIPQKSILTKLAEFLVISYDKEFLDLTLCGATSPPTSHIYKAL